MRGLEKDILKLGRNLLIKGQKGNGIDKWLRTEAE